MRRAPQESLPRARPPLAREARHRHHRQDHLVPPALLPPSRQRHHHHRCHALPATRARYSLYLLSLSNPPVLDEHTEFRGSLSLHPRSARGFDILTKRVAETPLALRSVDSLRSYIHSTSQSDSAVTPFRAAEEPAEDIDEKHFRCQSDEERESWLRVLRQARFPRFSFSR